MGAVLAIAILIFRDAAKPFGDALAPAAQVLLASVVAAFGLTQILIARDAMQSARATVQSTDEQTVVMREQVAQAREQADASARHAEDALRLARLEAMDTDAPIAALTCDDVRFAEAGRVQDLFHNAPEHAGEIAIEEDEARVRRFRYSGVATLTNFGERPVHWARSGTPDPELPHGGLKGLILPGGDHKFYVDETETLAAWMELSETRAQTNVPAAGFRVIEVTIYGARNLVIDTLTIATGPPPIRRDGSRYVVQTDRVAFWPTGIVRREYNHAAMSDGDQ